MNPNLIINKTYKIKWITIIKKYVLNLLNNNHPSKINLNHILKDQQIVNFIKQLNIETNSW